jgi:hypothetical protein
MSSFPISGLGERSRPVNATDKSFDRRDGEGQSEPDTRLYAAGIDRFNAARLLRL